MRKDALEDAEGQRSEVVSIHVIEQLLFRVSSHVDEKDEAGRKSSIEEELKGGHLGVPHAEELASNQIVGGEDGVHHEVKDGPFGVVWLLLFLRLSVYVGIKSLKTILITPSVTRCTK